MSATEKVEEAAITKEARPEGEEVDVGMQGLDLLGDDFDEPKTYDEPAEKHAEAAATSPAPVPVPDTTAPPVVEPPVIEPPAAPPPAQAAATQAPDMGAMEQRLANMEAMNRMLLERLSQPQTPPAAPAPPPPIVTEDEWAAAQNDPAKFNEIMARVEERAEQRSLSRIHAIEQQREQARREIYAAEEGLKRNFPELSIVESDSEAAKHMKSQLAFMAGQRVQRMFSREISEGRMTLDQLYQEGGKLASSWLKEWRGNGGGQVAVSPAAQAAPSQASSAAPAQKGPRFGAGPGGARSTAPPQPHPDDEMTRLLGE